MIEVGQTVGNYRITAKLGEGGMGIVFQAEHPVIARRAALKAIHPEFALSAEVISRFINEARVISQIGHEHIVDVTDFGCTPGGDFYFIMEHLGGEALSDAIRRGGAFAPARALAIAAQVADALEASHERGVVHCDLKPENVFLIPRGGTRDFVKVLDFGLATLTHGAPAALPRPSRSINTTVMGTPYYMAPEQCEGRRDIDHRADIYALGVILFEMLTGSVPFSGVSSGEILVKQVTMLPPTARALVPALPVALDLLLHRALAKNPADRFASMAELRAALLDPASLGAREPAEGDDDDGSDGRRARLRAARPRARAELEADGAGAPGMRTTFREAVGAFASVAELRPARQKGRAWLALVGAAVAAVALAWALPRLGGGEQEAAAPRAATVRVTFGSDPSGAEVLADGQSLGTTPLSIEVPPSDGSIIYLFRKAGFAPKAMSIIPNLSVPVFAALEHEPPDVPAAVARRARTPRRATPPGRAGDDEILTPTIR